VVLGRGSVSYERGYPEACRVHGLLADFLNPRRYGSRPPLTLSDTMYLISFRKSTPLQNRPLDISISKSKLVDNFVGELTF
jgi:hypothetical protein